MERAGILSLKRRGVSASVIVIAAVVLAFSLLAFLVVPYFYVSTVEFQVDVPEESFLSCPGAQGPLGCFTNLSFTGGGARGVCSADGTCVEKVQAGSTVTIGVDISFSGNGCMYPHTSGLAAVGESGNQYCASGGTEALRFTIQDVPYGLSVGALSFSPQR